MTSVNRAGAVVGLISLWEDNKALEAGERVAADSRAEAVRTIGGEVTVETRLAWTRTSPSSKARICQRSRSRPGSEQSAI
jgi:hypothetical protein